MTDIPTLYKGEAILLRWSDSSTGGRTVTFALEDTPDDPDGHPFKRVATGKGGQRVGLVVVALAEDQHVPATDSPAPSKAGSGGAGKERWDEMSYAKRSGILRNDERFIAWLGFQTADEAAAYIRRECGVGSCSKIDGNSLAELNFDKMYLEYQSQTGMVAEQRGWPCS